MVSRDLRRKSSPTLHGTTFSHQERSKTFFTALCLFILNIILTLPLFFGEYTQFTGSIESAFLTDARFIAQNFPNTGWDPLWYGGFPFHLSYLPLIPFLVAIIHQSSFGLISIGSAYRILTASAYSLTSPLIYIFVFYLRRRHSAGIVAAAFYSLLPAYLPTQPLPLVPVNLTFLVVYGEGPHTLGLALFPICSVLFLSALRRPSFRRYALASLFIALAFLTDLIAAFALAIILAVLLSSEMIRSNRQPRTIRAALVCALLTVGLLAFWYNFSFIDASLRFAGGSGSIALALLVSAASLGVNYAIFRRRRELSSTFLALSWTTIFFLFIALFFIFNITTAPQPLRYIPELLMGLAILFGLVASSILDTISKLLGRTAVRRASFAIIICVLILAFLFILPSAWRITSPNNNFFQGPEYQTATWLANHDVTGARVFATGSQAFWLNVFSNVPQLRGGSDQAAVNIKWWQPVTYLILGGSDANLSIQWLKALNVQYVVVDFPSAPLPYHDYLNASEFQGLLPLRYASNGTYIYEIPVANPELATVVGTAALESIGPVSSLFDVGGLSSYVKALSQAPYPVEIYSPNPDTVVIGTFLQNSSQGIVVKINFNQAWHATLNGHAISIEPDPVGFMLLKPESAGNVTIVLSYISATYDILAGYIITFATMIVCVILVVVERASKFNQIKSLRAFAKSLNLSHNDSK